jgi:hypothetical protein
MALARGIIMDGYLAENVAQTSRSSAGYALVLLTRALKIIDELELSSHVGARVQDAIEDLKALT